MIADVEGLAKVRSLTEVEVMALKSGEPDKMFPVFMQIMNRKYIRHFALVVRNIEKIIGTEVTIHDISAKSDYYADHFAGQMLHGDTDVLLGISGDDEAMLYLASSFSSEEFSEIHEDSYDALCELTNCINGNFATLLEEDEVELDIDPPMCSDGCRIYTNARFYVMKLGINGKCVDVISVIDVIPYFS